MDNLEYTNLIHSMTVDYVMDDVYNNVQIQVDDSVTVNTTRIIQEEILRSIYQTTTFNVNFIREANAQFLWKI